MFYFQSPSSNYFNKIWYKNTYELFDIDDNDLMSHYINIGNKLNYNPSLYFNTEWYKKTYDIPDNINPLEHFCTPEKKNLKPRRKKKLFVFFNKLIIIIFLFKNFFQQTPNKKKICAAMKSNVVHHAQAPKKEDV